MIVPALYGDLSKDILCLCLEGLNIDNDDDNETVIENISAPKNNMHLELWKALCTKIKTQEQHVIENQRDVVKKTQDRYKFHGWKHILVVLSISIY